MINTNWRNTTVDILSQRIGPAAGVIIDDVLESLNLQQEQVTSEQYARILDRLSMILPRSVKPDELCKSCLDVINTGTENIAV